MGYFYAWGTFFIGLYAGWLAWNRSATWPSSKALYGVLRLSFSGVVGLAVFSNLAFVVWAAGSPIALGVVERGQMGEHYWLGPFTMLYAILIRIVLKRPA